MKTIRTFSTRMEAQVALQLLQSSGIEAILSGDDAGGQRPFAAVTTGVDLQVPPNQVTEALALLEAKPE